MENKNERFSPTMNSQHTKTKFIVKLEIMMCRPVAGWYYVITSLNMAYTHVHPEYTLMMLTGLDRKACGLQLWENHCNKQNSATKQRTSKSWCSMEVYSL